MTRLGDALYRLVLLAFPRPFRQRYARQMADQFRAQRASLGTAPLARFVLWTRATFDALSHGSAVRREAYAAGLAVRRRSIAASAWLALPQDVRFAARGLARARGLTIVIVLTLTLGLASNAIMFGVVDQLLLQAPAGVGHPDGVRRVYLGSDAPDRQGSVVTEDGYPLVSAIRDGVRAFSAASVVSRSSVTVDSGTEARQATVDLVNASYFPMLELRPALGRFFSPTDDGVPDAAPVAVLSHAFWRARFGADPTAIGRALRVGTSSAARRPRIGGAGDVSLTVVGVGPKGFAGLEDRAADFWVPVGALARQLHGPDWASWPGIFKFGLVGRLSPDAADPVATAQATAAYRNAYAGFANLPFFDPLATATTKPLTRLEAPNGVPMEGRIGLWLLGVALVVLLVAVANVANLLLARAFSRRREIGVRLALGVSRARLLRQFLAEALLLALLAGGVALAVTWAAGRVVQTLLIPDFAWQASVVHPRLLVVTLALTMLTAVGAGLAPALYALRTDLTGAMHATSRVTGGRAGRLRSGLLVAQVALSALLLVGAGLFVRSLLNVRATDVGLDLDRVILGALPIADRPDAERVALYDEAASRVRAIPGVQALAVTGGSTPNGRADMLWFLAEGETEDALRGRAAPFYATVPAGYFDTLGADFEHGRDFFRAEERDGARIAVVNTALAAEYWPGQQAVGQCMYLMSDVGRSCTRVVGVVENISTFRLTERRGRFYLLPTHPAVADRPPTGFAIRTAVDAAAVLPDVRAALQSLTPDMPVVPVTTAEANAAGELRPWRLGTAIFLAFGAVAVLIAAVGLYSALAYLVSQRTHEIGIRMALGAPRRRIVARIAAYGAGMVATGGAIGLLAAAVAAPWLTDVLYQTSPRDPWVFLTVAAALALAGGAAAIVPARRSTSVDPLIVLKAD